MRGSNGSVILLLGALAWSAACSSGSGTLERPDDCAPGARLCGGRCSEVSTDPANCGECGRSCRADQTCQGGECTCAAGVAVCAGRCADLSTDPNHCGRCGNACAAGVLCNAGQCGGQSCNDPCPRPGGVRWGCATRFMLGINYAWHSFGGDFGGVSNWNEAGVSRDPSAKGALEEMAANGVSVVRWWVWPDFRGDGVTFDASGVPTGLGGSALADLDRALALAADSDVYLMLTLFSFDSFKNKTQELGWNVPNLKSLVIDPAKQSALIDKVLRPFARAAQASPHRNHLIAWDVMNEPEWAISGASKYPGDDPFTPNPECDTVSHDQMEAFFSKVILALRAESGALISVGSAAMKWKNAWSKLDLDFHQFHMYDWVNRNWPYARSPGDYGLTDKPVIWGEVPHGGLSGADLPTLLASWFGNGYAGALSWDYASNVDLRSVRDFASKNSCQTRY